MACRFSRELANAISWEERRYVSAHFGDHCDSLSRIWHGRRRAELYVGRHRQFDRHDRLSTDDQLVQLAGRSAANIRRAGGNFRCDRIRICRDQSRVTHSWTFSTNSQSYTISGGAVTFSRWREWWHHQQCQRWPDDLHREQYRRGGGGVQLHQAGSSTLVLTGTSTYTGGTTISAGTLQIGNGGTTGSIVGNVLNNGALVFPIRRPGL